MAVFRFLAFLIVLLPMQSILLGAEDPAIRKLSQLISPEPTSRLDEGKLKARLYMIPAHLEQTRLAGLVDVLHEDHFDLSSAVMFDLKGNVSWMGNVRSIT